MRSRAILACASIVVAAALAVVGAALAPAAYASCAHPVPDGPSSVVNCTFAGHELVFDVPAGVTSLRVVAAGARGGPGPLGGGGAGGSGAVATADIGVQPGRRLFVLVGGIGHTASTAAGAGGFNGGGSGGTGAASSFLGGAGGGGGGASDVRTCSIADRTCDTLALRLIVAGGGGGGGSGGNFLTLMLAGPGGAANEDGTGGAGGGSAGGRGATGTSGGAGGGGAGAGRLGVGGVGGAGTLDGGGGGGGGRYGGGGGASASTAASDGSGGGGGSSGGPTGTTFGRSTVAKGFVRFTYRTPSTVNLPPAVRITRPRPGTAAPGRGLVISGRARDASGVSGVALRIERLPRPAGACTWLDPVSGLGRASCAEPPWLQATLRRRGLWTYGVPKRIALPGGRYRATAYGTDETGIYGNSAGASAQSVTFRVRG